MYVKGDIPGGDYMDRGGSAAEAAGLPVARPAPNGSWLDSIMAMGLPGSMKLVGFGRATSDTTLTASIYDIVLRSLMPATFESVLMAKSPTCIFLPQVAPSLQGTGIGQRVMRRVIGELTRVGIMDIAVLSPPELRSFFASCGFGNDMLGSTTMTYLKRLPPGTQPLPGSREACRTQQSTTSSSWCYEPPPALSVALTLRRHMEGILTQNH
eukprot:SM000273S10250  [mRNA]  locus=s273:28490:29652:- [translate_table: standard]